MGYDKKEYNRRWKINNPEKVKEQRKRYVKKNKKKLLKKWKDYNNKLETKLRRRKWLDNNKERIRKQKRDYILRNPKKVKEIRRKYREKMNDILKERERIRRWAKDRLREQMLKRDNFQCKICKSKDNLQMHELKYEMPQKMKNLITLCRDCHKKEHRKLKN